MLHDSYKPVTTITVITILTIITSTIFTRHSLPEDGREDEQKRTRKKKWVKGTCLNSEVTGITDVSKSRKERGKGYTWGLKKKGNKEKEAKKSLEGKAN